MVNVVYTGTYQRAIDDKWRVMLPKKMREELDSESNLFLTPGTDRCLELHTPNSLHELARRANQSAAGSKNIKSFSRLFYAQAEQCEIDTLGRIRLPKNLVEYASLDKEIVIVGVGSNWEIWNTASWQRYLLSNEETFDLITQATFDSVPHSIEKENVILDGNSKSVEKLFNEELMTLRLHEVKESQFPPVLPK
jgi:MraZ protein